MEKDPIEDMIKSYYNNELSLVDFREVNADFWDLVNRGSIQTLKYRKNGEELEKLKEYNHLALELYNEVEQFNPKNKEVGTKMFWNQFRVVWGALMIAPEDVVNIGTEVDKIIEDCAGIEMKEGKIQSYIMLNEGSKYNPSAIGIVNFVRRYTPCETTENEMKVDFTRMIEYAVNRHIL